MIDKLCFSISPTIPKYCYLIAEIGINHNGSISIAKDLILKSKMAGFDAVKFQKRTIDIVYTKNILDSYRESPWGKTTREQKEGLEFSLDDYDEIDKYCKSIDIEWSASSWDINSQIEMRRYNFPFNKVASAMATNDEFVKEVAKEKKLTFASTGMMNLNQIDQLYNIFKDEDCPVVLMHTVSTYPAREEDLNLYCIKTLAERYKIPIGYSGHESSTAPSIFAATLGAVAIERHVTLDRAMYGSDQSASLEIPGMNALCSTIRKINICLGDGVKDILEEEKKVASKLRYWRSE